MSQSRSAITRRLVQARQDRVPVVVRTTDPHTKGSYGFIVAVTRRWLVLHDLQEGVFLDDLVLLRLKDVAMVKPHPNLEFVTRAVAALGTPIYDIECAADITTDDLLRRVAVRDNLVCLNHKSSEGHRWREVGVIRAVGSKQLEFHGVKDDGTWLEDSGLRPLKHIRRVELGGRYLATLERLCQPLPAPTAEAQARIAKLETRN